MRRLRFAHYAVRCISHLYFFSSLLSSNSYIIPILPSSSLCTSQRRAELKRMACSRLVNPGPKSTRTAKFVCQCMPSTVSRSISTSILAGLIPFCAATAAMVSVIQLPKAAVTSSRGQV